MDKHLLTKISAILTLLCIICLNAAIPAENVRALQSTGNINVQIAPFAEGVKLSLYEIGTCDTGFKLNSTFSELNDTDLDIAHLKDAHEMKEAADTIVRYAYDFDIDPVAKARVDSQGVAKFFGVDADFKLYVIAQTSDKNTVAIGSFIVRMPYYTKIGGEYLYNLKVQEKYLDTRDKDKLGAIVLNKTCAKGNPLQGAEFRFEQKMYYSNEKMIPENAETGEDRNGKYYWKMLARRMTTNEQGQIVVQDLPFGIYRFIETRAPYKWILDDTPIIAYVEAYGTVKLTEDGYYVEDEGLPEILRFINEPEPDPCNSNPCQQSSSPCQQSSTPCQSTPSEPSCPSCPSIPDISYPSDISFPSFPSYPDISYPSMPSETTDPEVTHPSDISYPDISYPDISYPDISYPSSSEPDISYPDISYPDISYPDISYPDVSYPDVSYPDISYPDVSYPGVSYPSVSYPSVSYPSVSYPQIVPDGKGNSVVTGDDIGRYIITTGAVIVSLSSAIVLVFASRKKKKQ